MNKEQLIKELRSLKDLCDPEIAHAQADALILEYINDDEIEEAYDEVEKWYA